MFRSLVVKSFTQTYLLMDTSTLNGMLQAVSEFWKISVRLNAIITASHINRSVIARAIGMSLKIFRRKLNQHDFTAYEIFQIISFLLKADQTLATRENKKKWDDILRIDEEISSHKRCCIMQPLNENSPDTEEAISDNIWEAFHQQHYWFMFIIDHLNVNNVDEMNLKAQTHSVVKRMEWLMELRGCSISNLYRIFRKQVLYNQICYSPALLSIDSEEDFTISFKNSMMLPCLNLLR
jgi:hypothetical protein